MQKTIIITNIEAGERADIFLAQKFSDYSRSYFAKLIKDRKITINSNQTKPSYILKEHDKIQIDFVEIVPEFIPEGEDIPLEIIYEDNNVIVVNKQAGLVVHPAAGNKTGTLVNALLNHFPKISQSVFEKDNIKSQTRAGIVHRLDKDTSGVILVAKNSKTLASLSKKIKNRNVTKIYWALCYGWPKEPQGILINYLDRHPKNRKIVAEVGKEKGREAISHYKVIDFLEYKDGTKASLIEFDIKTGRTHQIRVQSALMGHPIIGDSVYGNKPSIKFSSQAKVARQLLHAKSITITIPEHEIPSVFEAPLPNDFKTALELFRKIID